MNKITLPSFNLTTEADISDSPALQHQNVVVAIGAVGLLVFVLMLVSYWTKSLFFALDEPVRSYFETVQTASPKWVNGTFKVIETLGSDGLTVASVLLALLWLVQRKWRPFSLILVGIAGMELTWLSWLYLINRPRPEEVVSKFSNSSLPSFPSGHTMFFITFFTLMLYIFFANRENRRLQLTALGIVVGLMLLTGVIRLFFAAHYFTDVLAGYGWGLFWAAVTILVVENFFQRRTQTRN